MVRQGSTFVGNIKVMNQTLRLIIANPELHAGWLNSLSFMENAGARKISACEDECMTGIIQLKHAAEEHRHAYYLKKQIGKLDVSGFQFYEEASMLAGKASKQYLHRLDIQVCRYLKSEFQLSGQELKYAAYLFVTYAIEVRADALYPIYQEELSAAQSKVMVKSIILEEEGHLEEMISQLNDFHPDWESYANEVLMMEDKLFSDWLVAIVKDVESKTKNVESIA